MLAAVFSDPTVLLGLAGGSGGASRWFYAIILEKKMLPKQAAATIALGVILGVFVSPFFAPTLASWLGGFQTDAARLPFFAAFATGAGGVGLLGFGIDFFKLRYKATESGAQGLSPPMEKTEERQ